MSNPTTIGSGVKKFLFEVGELGMLHVEIRADSRKEAVRYISSGKVLKDFPAYMRDELLGQEFRLIKES